MIGALGADLLILEAGDGVAVRIAWDDSPIVVHERIAVKAANIVVPVALCK